jgi:hypothetical protein
MGDGVKITVIATGFDSQRYAVMRTAVSRPKGRRPGSTRRDQVIIRAICAMKTSTCRPLSGGRRIDFQFFEGSFLPYFRKYKLMKERYERQGFLHQSNEQSEARKKSPPSETNAEIYYYKKQIDARTVMVVSSRTARKSKARSSGTIAKR